MFGVHPCKEGSSWGTQIQVCSETGTCVGVRAVLLLETPVSLFPCCPHGGMLWAPVERQSSEPVQQGHGSQLRPLSK